VDTESELVARFPDDRFWVRLVGEWTPDPAIRWRINGNANTHRGRLHVCAIDQDLHRTVNLADIAEASPDAQLWLAGFLNGQQIGLFEFMGRSVELYDAFSDEDVERWRRWNAEFSELGYEPSVVAMMPPPLPDLNDLRDPRPWVYVADQYRIWLDGQWVVPDPQPIPISGRRGWAWPGTLCEGRGHHSLEQLDTVSICEDCHEVTF
jgi:hypothetical protein